MAIDTLYLKRKDLQPWYYAQVKDPLGTVVDITGATILCTMKHIITGTIKVNRANAGITIIDAANGRFCYKWQSGDTDTAGSYSIEFEVNPLTGGKYTLPAYRYAMVIIEDALDIEYIMYCNTGQYYINGKSAELTKA